MDILKELKKENIEYQIYNNGYHIKTEKHINIYPTTCRIFNNITKENFIYKDAQHLINYLRNTQTNHKEKRLKLKIDGVEQ